MRCNEPQKFCVQLLGFITGTSALSRGAGNELIPASNAGIMDKGIRLQDGTTDERDGDKDRPCMVDTIYCSDQDYETAEVIGSKMLMHMAMAYRMIKGDEAETMPEVKGLDHRKMVFDELKVRYQLNDLIKEAKSQGVSRSSAIRWNNQWIEKGMVIKENHGEYRKVA